MGPSPRRPSNRGFDFTEHMRRLCQDLVRRLPQLGHVNLDRVALSFSQTRARHAHGVFATLTPLRCSGRHATGRASRKLLPELRDPAGHLMLYILTFYLPRFLDLPFREELTTVVHELWHISPECDGDLRRFPGRCYVHGSSQKQFDATVSRLADQWLARRPPPEVFEFLRHDFRGLLARYGAVYGTRIRLRTR